MSQSSYSERMSTLEGRAKIMLYRARHRAKKKGLPFNLDYQWILERLRLGHCEVTGLPYNYDRAASHANPLAPSIDQRLPGEGYTKDNARMVCTMFNQAKQDYGEGALIALCRSYLRKLEGDPEIERR